MELSVVAFIDILGYSAMVNADALKVEQVNLPRIQRAIALTKADERTQQFQPQVFSDSVILAGKFSPQSAVELIETCALLQRSFLKERILVRGGITFGKHHFADGVLFSQGLVDAYRIEKEEARFPRIVLDGRNLMDWLLNDKEFTTELRNRAAKLCMRDRDQRWFVSYLSEDWIEAHAKLLEQYLVATDLSQDTILEKAQWLVAYHNHMATSAKRTDCLIEAHKAEFSAPLVEK